MAAMAKIHGKADGLLRRMSPLVPLVGTNASRLPGVSFERVTRGHGRHPAVYEPSIKIVAQGSIRNYLGRDSFRYDADNYCVLAVPMPMECDIEASLAEPLMFMSVDLDWTTIGCLLAETGRAADDPGPVPRALCASALTPDLREAILRLLGCLGSAMDARVLGPAIVREIFYRVLLGPQGGVLRAAAVHHGGFARVSRALRLIHHDYAKCPAVEDLARAAGMSVPSFHRHFKAVTATSPQRYVQTIRLHKARSLLVDERIGVAAAGARVGYESASQFSREFRRLFGHSPKLPPPQP